MGKPLDRAEVRRLVADLIRAAGCSCCRDSNAWDAAEEALGRLLRVPKYSDGSGRDWYWGRVTKRRAKQEGRP